jgi:1-acyl-sn-glycerol-3-phosphate acyltransferase
MNPASPRTRPGDLYYRANVRTWRFPFWVSSRSPTVLHRDRVPRTGPIILAANHLSPFDVPVLMWHTPRILDFVSTVEVMGAPLVGPFYRSLGAFPLDRSRVDVRTTKTILSRLAAGRVVAMVPEGRIRQPAESVLVGAPFRPGVARLAQLAHVPIVPVVVTGTIAWKKWYRWLPTRTVRVAVNYGEPIPPGDDADALRQLLAAAGRDLYAELQAKGSA